ncbi:MAG: hypothetical protein WAP55_03075 [Minisyncoccia bacterium]
MFKFTRFNKFTVAAMALASLGTFTYVAYATHSWGGYHWARTANPFNLKLGDNVSGVWDTHLPITSSDWSVSTVFDTTIVAGQTNPKSCKAVLGKVQVCNSKYGNNSWLGLAQIWVSGNHIVQGITKLNDTYFNTATYNTPAWRNLVMCQEAGHALGLDHQDEIFNNPNLGTCMDYTSDPSTNQHPNQHDYDQLATIYSHLDSVTTISQALPNGNADDVDRSSPKEWGKEIRKSRDGKYSLFERDLGKGQKLFTFVIWAN